MKAFLRSRYGGPEVLHLGETEKPTVGEGQIVVRIMANSVNPADWHFLRGDPVVARLAFGLFKPRSSIIGVDFSGVVESVGPGVTMFREGDRVFGENVQCGAFAEFMAVDAKACAHMPPGVGFAEMACAPVAGITAYQALFEYGKLQRGESVFVNGSSGGVGHLVVQMAKAIGAVVTAVCSSRNVAFVQSLGADRVIPYDQQGLDQHKGRYDLVVDVQGSLPPAVMRRLGKRAVMIGFTSMGHMFASMMSHKIKGFPCSFFTAKANTADLEKVARMMADGLIKMHIEKTYGYKEIPDAIRHVESFRTRGKVAVEW